MSFRSSGNIAPRTNLSLERNSQARREVSPLHLLHYRVENTGSEKLVFIEVQSGNYLGEDDIVRLEDD